MSRQTVMRIKIVGAGPAGLYAAILLKRWRSSAVVTVYERNALASTHGFGLVFSDQALEFLRADDPETADLIEPQMHRWSGIDVVHRDERITIDGIGFSGVSRKRLLATLHARAERLGVEIVNGYSVTDETDLDADLVIGADGVNSIVRACGRYDEKISYLSNRFAWFGTTQTFHALTQTFIDTEFGPMNAHHYTYELGCSTFIVEMPNDVFARAGLGDCSAGAARRACENWFGDTLGGAELIADRSAWRQFPQLSCSRWHDGHRVLVGDALHTAHFSIGSGTRLALEDVIALVKALRAADGDVAVALPAYQAARQPVLEKLTRAACASGEWYDHFAQHMELEPWPFALSYIQRAGRLDHARLRAMAPRFAAELSGRSMI